VHHHHSLDLVLAVGRAARLDPFHISAAPPVARQKIDVNLNLSAMPCQHGELLIPAIKHIAWRQRIHERGFHAPIPDEG
jgi:hypothetical protein